MIDVDCQDKPNDTKGIDPKPAGSAKSCATIGYLVPEFPGQTHNFFNREIKALSKQNVHASVISTQPPQPANRSEALEAEFAGRVSHIFPFRLAEIPRLAGMLAYLRMSGIGKALKVIFDASNRGFKNRTRLLLLAVASAKLALLARRDRWTHAHVHSCADAANVALFSHLLFGTTYSLTLHNPIHVYGGNQPAKFGHAKFAIFITSDIRNEAAVDLGSSMPTRSIVAPMGVEPSAFQRSSPYIPYRSEGELRLVCCARLSHAKGQKYLIDAVALLVDRGMSIQLVLAGEDDFAGTGYRQDIERQITNLGLTDQVTLLGSIDEEQVRAELEASHIFVLPSLSEPLGVAIMEAMAMELPVISTNAGGVPLLIEHGRDGLLVPSASAVDLADAIQQIASDPSRSAALASQARKTAEKSFSARRSATAIASSIES